MSYGIPSPCLDCEDRHIACHDKCDRYAEYRKQIDKIRNAEHADVSSRLNRPTAPQKHRGDRRWTRE